LRLGEEIGSEHPYGWLKVFDKEELYELTQELESNYQLAGLELDPQVWDHLYAVIHEWHESAIAIGSKELATAFNDQLDEVPLTQPIFENNTDNLCKQD
jgi:hypothetical protein